MQSSDNDLETALNEHKYVFAYGPTINLTALRILNVATSLTSGTVFCVYRTNQEARSMYETEVGMSLESSGIGLAVGDYPAHMPPKYDIYTDRIIYCTSGKFRNILLEQIRRQRVARFGWVILDSLEEYDVNAYVVAALVRKYTQASITLVSASERAPLPYEDSVKVYCPNPSHKIVYTGKYPTQVVSESTLPIVQYGPDKKQSERSNVTVFAHVSYKLYRQGDILIDTLKDLRGKPISKHMADKRSDTLHSGTVYRLSTEEQYDKLRARDAVTGDGNLEEAVLHLLQEKLDPMEILGNTHPHDRLKEAVALLSGTGYVTEEDLDRISSLRMGVMSGLFYVTWRRLAHSNGFVRENNRERERYIPGLIAALVEHPPAHYAPLENYRQFVGRNDIETLCNMWSSLLLTRPPPFWKAKRDGAIHVWCKEHGFVYVSIAGLIENMKRVCLGMEGELFLFDKIKTHELNRCTEAWTVLQKASTKKVQKWAMNETLPTRHRTILGNVLPILHKGKSLKIYIDSTQAIVKPTIAAESLDIFSVL